MPSSKLSPDDIRSIASSLSPAAGEPDDGLSVVSWLESVGKPVGDLLSESCAIFRSFAELCDNTEGDLQGVSMQNELGAPSGPGKSSILSDAARNWAQSRFDEASLDDAFEIMVDIAVIEN
jgi:hypothetical protein